MINLDNKQERLALAERFLDAETTVQEEQMLARYYATHPVESDEKEFAAMLAVSRSEADSSLLADTSVFDRIVGKTASKQHAILAWTSAAAVAAILIIPILVLKEHSLSDSSANMSASEPVLTPQQVIDGIETMIKLEPSEVASVTAKPTGSTMLIVVELQNGKEKKYLMESNSSDGSVSFYALN